MTDKAFSPLRFALYRRDLARAIYQMSGEYRMSIEEIKQRLRDVPGIENLTMRLEGGNQVFSLGGPFAPVSVTATAEEIDAAIRALSVQAASPGVPLGVVKSIMNAQSATLAPVNFAPPPAAAPAPMSFAASLRAIMDNARADLERARQVGTAKVTDAASKLAEAQAATLHVTGTIAKTIEDEAAAVMAELGTISNAFGGENG